MSLRHASSRFRRAGQAASGLFVLWGAASIAAGTDATRFAVPGGSNAAPSTVQCPIVFPWDVRIVRLRWVARGACGTSGAVTFKLFNTGADTGVSIDSDINNSNSSLESTTGLPLDVAAGEAMTLRIDTTSLAGTYQGWAVAAEYELA